MNTQNQNTQNHITGSRRQDLPAISAGEHIGGQLVSSTDRAHLATPIRVIELSHEKVRVRTDGIVSDHDETISIGTGEHVHDGHVARFAQGLSLALLEHNEVANDPFLKTEHLSRFVMTNSIFCPNEWLPFKGQSGKSEDQVLRGMLTVSFERFKLDQFDFEALLDRVTHHAGTVLRHGFQDFMKNVTLDQGLARTLERANKEGIPIAVCSASQEHLVIETLRHFELMSKDGSMSVDIVDVVIGNAVKKVDANTFCGAAIAKACQELSVAPARTIMFGDSIGDVAAAARAGIGSIFVCVREPHMLQGIRKEIESFQRQERYNKELMGKGEPITVYLVNSFSQVEVEGRIPASEQRTSCYLDKFYSFKGV